MNIGIISFAHMHANSYADCLLEIDGVSLYGISDDNVARGNAAAERYDTRFIEDYHNLLALNELDGVIICTENAKHKEVVLAAAKAGKHVLCEKPLAVNKEDAWEMIEVCRQHGVILQTAFPVRYNASVKRVKQMIEKGDLGRIVSIRSTNRGQNPGGWFVNQELSGGGAVLDHTVHVIDLMRWFMNSEVKEVYAEIDTKFCDFPIDDCGILTLEFDNGVFASHDPSWSRSKTFPTWGDVTMEIVGTKGVTRLNAFAQNLTLYSDKEKKISQEFWGNSMDKGLIQDFISAITEKREPSISGYDGLKAMEVALAAYESARLKKPVLI
ncbi:Gfo/Idh/MocA family protein [Bacillus massilinigeriensis]|uniref:Gfo/Idh/MocA family protein n=1 Tax=Bacillus massilionigeriensis TaxID=1805475 RepID=UPI00096B3614|nr:Gfo/Idh/MocA family oxidoreductase [Bacillus massilionigeriensis]